MKNKLLTFACALLTLSLTAQDAAEATTAETAAETAVTTASKYNEALAELKAKNYAGASSLFDETLAMADSTEDADIIKLASSNSAISKYYLGNAQLKEGKMDEAMATYEM
ncbi:MAG: hypothetical protein KTR24_17440, partial [Saprospiraceae bacterium]|nr:hypothetical protein [Saprospiraceae bacterium]